MAGVVFTCTFACTIGFSTGCAVVPAVRPIFTYIIIGTIAFRTAACTRTAVACKVFAGFRISTFCIGTTACSRAAVASPIVTHSGVSTSCFRTAARAGSPVITVPIFTYCLIRTSSTCTTSRACAAVAGIVFACAFTRTIGLTAGRIRTGTCTCRSVGPIVTGIRGAVFYITRCCTIQVTVAAV